MAHLTNSMMVTQKRYGTLENMRTAIEDLNEELEELTPQSKELGRKWEVQTYHRSFNFIMANTTWKHIHTLPLYMKIPLVVVPLFLGIGDVFFNLFHFTAGNLIKLSINSLTSDFLSADEKEDLTTINLQIKEIRKEIFRLNKYIRCEETHQTDNRQTLEGLFRRKDQTQASLRSNAELILSLQKDIDQIVETQAKLNKLTVQLEMIETALKQKSGYDQGSRQGLLRNIVVPYLPSLLGGNPFYGYNRQKLSDEIKPKLLEEVLSLEEELKRLPYYERAIQRRDETLKEQRTLETALTDIDREIGLLYVEIDNPEEI